MAGVGLGGLPFVIAGSLKIAYDLLLYRGFRAHRPPEERPPEERPPEEAPPAKRSA
jgi:hypothetical protein